MSVLSNPKALFFGRLIQLAFATAFLVVVAYSNTHKGAWYHLEGPVALGVVSTLLTLVITGHGVWSHFRTDFIKLHGRVYVVARMIVDFLLLLCWVGTATLMLRPRDIDPSVPIIPVPQNPDIPWNIGIAFSFVEIVFFAVTIFLVFKEHRAGRKGGASAAYV